MALLIGNQTVAAGPGFGEEFTSPRKSEGYIFVAGASGDANEMVLFTTSATSSRAFVTTVSGNTHTVIAESDIKVTTLDDETVFSFPSDFSIVSGNTYALSVVGESGLSYGTDGAGAESTRLNFTALPDDSLLTITSPFSTISDTTPGVPTIWVQSLVSGPTLTGPASTTEQAATVAAGTLLDTVTIFSLISGTFSIEQTIDSATATTLNYVAESGVNDCAPSAPVSGVPLEATISAAGVTPYQIQQEADDEVNTPATFNITLNGEATHEVVQTMIAVANTTVGESIFGTNLIAVEDDMQAYVVKAANGMNITWAADGTFTTDADQTETITVGYFSAATGQWSCLELTIKDTSIIASGGILRNILRSPLKDILRNPIK